MKTAVRNYQLKHNYPFNETILMGAFVALFCASINGYYRDNDTMWLLMSLASIVGFSVVYWMTNFRNKTISFKKNELEIKYWLKKTSIKIKIEDIQGYLKKEVYTHGGLGYNIHIYCKDGRKYKFINDVYSDFNMCEYYLKAQGVKNLGTKDITWKYKNSYSRIVVISSVASGFLFLLFQLLKILK